MSEGFRIPSLWRWWRFVVSTVSFSTVSLGPLTAAAPQRSPAAPSHYGSRKPRVTVKKF